MRIRGARRCQDCETRWSYYETGEVACPSCGSLRSVGVDDRTRHTDGPVTLDITPSRTMVDSEGLLPALDDAADRAREFVRRSGFIHAGALKPLSEEYLASLELSYVAREYTRGLSSSLDDEEELYLLTLLRGADLGDRPAPEDVPESARVPRNLAYTRALDDYRSECRTYLDDNPAPAAARTLGRIGDHVRRIEALDGAVPPATTETLVAAIRAVATSLLEGDGAALDAAEAQLDGLAES